MHSSVRRLLPAVLAAAFTFGCACANNAKTGAATPAGAAGPSGDTVVATYGAGKKVTLKEIDELLGEDLTKLEQQKFEMRSQAAEQMVIQALVKEKAAKEGKTEEEWLKANVDAKLEAPADAEIQKLFDESKGRLPPEVTFEQVKPQIVDYLQKDKKREVVKAVFGALKTEANLKITLAAPEKQRKSVEAKGPTRGPEGAKVTIVEFSDFQCPFCSRAHDTVEEVMKQYGGKVRLTFRHFPLEFHAQAPKAAEASLCADEQKKFWEYHDALFANQEKLQLDDLKAAAKTLGLDAEKFNTCLDSGKMAEVVKADTAAGKKVGVSGTPAFFINGVMLSGAQPIEEFKKIIDAELN